MNAMERERMEIRDELRGATSRFHALSAAQDELREQLSLKAEQHSMKAEEVESMRSTINILHQQLSEKDSQLAALQGDLGKSELDRIELRQRVADTERSLEGRLASAKAKEKLLATDLKQLQRYLGKREKEVIELADELDTRDSALASLSASRRLSKYLARKSEREEAERLEILARHRARRAMHI